MSGAGALVWIDGRVVPAAQARVPVTDHGLLYGDGLFEGIRVYGGRVFRLDRHLARLAAGARALALTIPGGVAAIREIVLETVRAYREQDAYVRLVVTRGEGELGVDPTSCAEPRIFCLVDRVRLYSEAVLERGLDLRTSSLRRPPADVLDPRVKSLNYLNSALAVQEARRSGADEALLLNAAGRIAEASVANVFVSQGCELATPPVVDGALEGVTRATVLELAPRLGLRAVERSLGRADCFAAEEMFLTGSGAGLVPVRRLDGAEIGAGKPGPIFARVRDGFLAAAPGLGVAV